MGVVHLAARPLRTGRRDQGAARAHRPRPRRPHAARPRGADTGPGPGRRASLPSWTPTPTATGPTSSPATSPGRRWTRWWPTPARCAVTRCCGSGAGLSDALTAIHRAGVVHRDLKPANVLLLDGDPVVIDFGIAHVADDIRLTMTGLVMGTPGYLSPEVVEGAPVTTATDWWGWAATLAFAASGQPPFGRGPMDVVLDRVRRGQADLSGVDPRLAPVLAAALSPQFGRASARRRDRRGPRPLRRRCARDGDRPGGRAHRSGRPRPHQDPGSVRRALARSVGCCRDRLLLRAFPAAPSPPAPAGAVLPAAALAPGGRRLVARAADPFPGTGPRRRGAGLGGGPARGAWAAGPPHRPLAALGHATGHHHGPGGARRRLAGRRRRRCSCCCAGWPGSPTGR